MAPLAEGVRGRRICVIGAGVAGLSLARCLSRRGARVAVVEARRAGEGASGAAAGVLRTPRGGSTLLARLSMAAHAGYEAYARGLAEETGIDTGFRRTGLIDLALDASEEADLRVEMARFQDRGVEALWLTAREVRDRLPGAVASVRGGLFLPGTACLHPGQLLAALKRSAELRGVDVIEGRRASLRRGGAGWEAEVDGPEAARVAGRPVLVAAGAWSGALLSGAGISPAAPMKPIRGQMSEMDHDAPLATIVHHREVYVVPRDAGRVWVGATVEDVGFDESTTEEGLRSLAAAAANVFPGLGCLRRSWAGLRPKLLRRGGPLLGEGDPPVLAGHYRSGILLGPITAEVLAARLDGATTAEGMEFGFLE